MDAKETGTPELEQDQPEPANLRFLRRLVTVLTMVMIVGVIAIVALLVIRLSQPARMVPIPAQIALPEGTRVVAITQTAQNVLVVTEGQNLLIFDASGTELLQAVPLDIAVQPSQ
ncbi:MAG: DUF6476 family protein [Pseudomonadota bacterium]